MGKQVRQCVRVLSPTAAGSPTPAAHYLLPICLPGSNFFQRSCAEFPNLISIFVVRRAQSPYNLTQHP